MKKRKAARPFLFSTICIEICIAMDGYESALNGETEIVDTASEQHSEKLDVFV